MAKKTSTKTGSRPKATTQTTTTTATTGTSTDPTTIDPRHFFDSFLDDVMQLGPGGQLLVRSGIGLAMQTINVMAMEMLELLDAGELEPEHFRQICPLDMQTGPEIVLP